MSRRFCSNTIVNAEANRQRAEIDPANFTFRRTTLGEHENVLIADYPNPRAPCGFESVCYLSTEDRAEAANHLALCRASNIVAGETARSEWP